MQVAELLRTQSRPIPGPKPDVTSRPALIAAVAAHLHSEDMAEPFALDLGCGTGKLHRYLRAHMRGLHGLDRSPTAIEIARSSNPNCSYSCYVEPIIPLRTGQFDVTLSIKSLCQIALPERKAMLREMARVTRPDGWVGIVLSNPLHPLNWPRLQARGQGHPTLPALWHLLSQSRLSPKIWVPLHGRRQSRFRTEPGLLAQMASDVLVWAKPLRVSATDRTVRAQALQN